MRGTQCANMVRGFVWAKDSGTHTKYESVPQKSHFFDKQRSNGEKQRGEGGGERQATTRQVHSSRREKLGTGASKTRRIGAGAHAVNSS